ncbi:MAG: ABC transporter permease [Candidatus Palauibacterales bacterium]|nr:ABC transporter permease [Candidatus Palauibacterales bacterium]MDP2529192.1 ABC transporter permease [Candidatus Palauibacterales bacterium]
MLDGPRQDLRLALREIRRAPGFAVPAILTLALGIGASVAVFSVVDHILFRPLSIRDSGRVVTICETGPRSGDYCAVATPNLVDWARSSRSIETMGAARTESMALRTAPGARGVSVGIAMPGFLRALAIAPERGRMLAETDGPPDGDGRVAVVSHEFWSRELGGDPDVLGRTMVLDGDTYRVIGVLPEGASVPRLEHAQVWIPLPWDPATAAYRDWRGFVSAARLAPGVSLQQARAELRREESALASAFPETVGGWSVDVHPMRAYLVRSARPLLLALLFAVALVLLLACTTVSGLVLARAVGRRRDMAVRYALGAGRGRLVSGLLVEGLVLSALGGGAGAFLAMWGVRALRALAPPGIPRLDRVVVDGRILLVAGLVTVVTGLAVGILPALRLRDRDLGQLFGGARGTSIDRKTRRSRRVLVAGQLALALVLVTGSGLLLRSFNNLLDWRPGFDTEHLLTFWTFASQGKYPEPPGVLSLYRRIDARLEGLPGVRSVGTVSAGPLFGGGDGLTPLLIQGRGWTRDQAPGVAWYDAGPDYFRTLGEPLLRGRTFRESDDASAPTVAVINRAMAARFWPNGEPVGATLTLPELDGAPTVRVVGVVADVQPFLPDRAIEPEIYLSNRQRTRWATYFVIRTDGDPAALAPAVRRALAGIDSDLEASHLGTMRDHIGAQLVQPRFEMLVVSVFAVIAMLLGVLGLYGLIAYTTRARAGEIGMRLALGASPRRVVLWVLGDAAGMIAVGGLAGIAGGLLFARALRGTLHGVPTEDPITFATAVVVLGTCALLAALRPAVRAARMDPARALREE